jgi:hypothetical protein
LFPVLQNGLQLPFAVDYRIINARIITMLLENAWVGDLDMADIARLVLFILACTSLCGLGVYLFRDQIWPEKYKQTS